MNERALQQVSFANHRRTLDAAGLDLEGMLVFDAAGRLLWSDGAGPLVRRIAAELAACPRPAAGAKRARVTLADGEALLAVVDDEVDGRLFELVLRLPSGGIANPAAETRLAAALDAVAANMLNEFQLNRELESMAGELGARYDELNLVFQSDDESTDGMFGYESLRRLVCDSCQFLGVGMAALLLPAKHAQLYHQERPIEVPDLRGLLVNLQRRHFERMCDEREPIVVNSRVDRLRAGLSRDFPCKLMMVPVQAGGIDVVGMLVVANEGDSIDFTNSDRKLLEVMAGKITRVMQANFDSLTGLENAHTFEWTVQQALQRSRNRGFEHALLHVNLDRTGVVNDVSGREAGDALLRYVGQLLSSRVRAQDSVARLSGDRFGVLLEMCALESAAELAADITRQVAASDFEWEGTMHPLSVCIGVAPVSAESETVAAVLSAAEVACDAAKEKGRNRVQVYEHGNVDLLRRRSEFRWVGRIQAALRENRFELHAQLIQPLKVTSELPHYEVLVRMRDEDGGLVPPGNFLPAAEHYHLMQDIDRWVLGHALQALTDGTRLLGRAPFRLSINLSGQSLADEKLARTICEQVASLGDLATHICLEITESAVIANMEQAQAFIAEVKKYGCRFSLDDFGSGLSSFAYLQRFDVDYLKIDGSFVRRVGSDPVADSMVSAINQVGQVMGLETIAEFVENEVIARALREIGVDHAQGYHFHRPTMLNELLQGLFRTQGAANG